MTMLTLSSVTKRFGRFTANQDVSFDVAAGEVVGLLGANGAGKTTAIRQALGLSTPTAGVVTQFGEAPSRRTRTRVGYLPQGLGLWPDLSVAENLEFVARSYGPDGASGSAGGSALPPDLAADRDTPVGDLPLGRQRRVAFAAALGHDPELLVLDEPTSGVDVLARSRLWDVIRFRADRGAGVLVTTHFMDEARQCDRLLIMDDGRVVLRGSLEDIVGDRTVVEVRSNDWAKVFAALDAAGFGCGLAGTAVRVLSADTSSVGAALSGLGVETDLSRVAATLEETMVSISRNDPGPDQPRSPDSRRSTGF